MVNLPRALSLSSRYGFESRRNGGSVTTILVVEDDPLVRLHVCGVLEDDGYQVVATGRAEIALQHLASNDTIGLVLTDVRLPGAMDGLRLASDIRERWPDMPIILNSGLSEADLRAPAGVRFLRKPFGINALLKVCGEAVLQVA